jgi:hypothetical protein
VVGSEVKVRTVYIVVGALVIVVLTIPMLRWFKNAPNAATISMQRILTLVQEAREFRFKVGRNPRSANELLVFSPFESTNRLIDGWGNEFRIEVAEDGGIKIFSNGEDHKPGGAGDMGTFLPP